jgi:hypothetical protein
MVWIFILCFKCLHFPKISQNAWNFENIIYDGKNIECEHLPSIIL